MHEKKRGAAVVKNPTAADVRFDRPAHRYFLGDDEIPAVGRILRQAGLVDPSYFSEEVAQRGRYVADAVNLLNHDNLNRDSIDPEIAGYVEAFERLRDEEELEILEAERIVFDPLLWYAGTLDLTFLKRIRPSRRVLYGVLELKTGVRAAWHALQVEPYRRALEPPTQRQSWRPFLGYLQKDGSHSGLVPVKAWTENWRTFQEALDLFAWRVRHGDRTAYEDRREPDHVGDYASDDALPAAG